MTHLNIDNTALQRYFCGYLWPSLSDKAEDAYVNIHFCIVNLQLDIQVNTHREGGVELNCDNLEDSDELTLENIHKHLPGKTNM